MPIYRGINFRGKKNQAFLLLVQWQRLIMVSKQVSCPKEELKAAVCPVG